MNTGRAALLVSILLSSGAASAQILRCTAPDGAVTYQQTPCEGRDGRIINVPTEYPAPNVAERERLFAREAQLERRLEAQRERESREWATRLAVLAASAPPAEPVEPQYVFAGAYPRFARPRPTPHVAHHAPAPLR
jgi:hypothetical protein